jgi:Siphovirus Gp157.
MPNLDPLAVRLQVEQLFREFPEMAEDEILRVDMLEGSTDLHKFLSTIESYRQEVMALVMGTDLILDDLLQRKRRFERREEGLRRLMFQMLQLAQLRKIELSAATLSLKNGSPRVIITDESAIPDDLCRFKREPDKAAIKAKLQSNGHVAGATLSNAEENLAIRTR